VTGPVRKVAGWVPISAELLADRRGRRATPEDAERWARERQAAAELLAARLARHARLLDVVTGPRRDLVELHGPESATWSGVGYVCHGCEIAGYEAEPPDWPCSTWVIAAEGEW
jgi:hypothetical protein